MSEDAEDRLQHDLYDAALNELYFLRSIFAEEALRKPNRGTRRGEQFMKIAKGEWRDVYKADNKSRYDRSYQRQEALRAVGATPVLTNYQHRQEYFRDHPEVPDASFTPQASDQSQKVQQA